MTTAAMILAFALATVMVLPTLLGYERYVIVSGSMEPTLPVGSVVYDEVVPVDELEVGDIITFVPPPEYGITDPVTHRIMRIVLAEEGTDAPGERIFRTQGDNNADMDPWLMVLDGPDQGRVVHHIPYVGYVYMALQVGWVQFLVIGVPAVALIVYIVVALWRLSGDAVREEQQRETAEAEQETEQEAAP
ncbi:signal peptidase I [Nocardioides sp. SR21]|uniref:signal peptidase I n=1 Tax=Nocardioides sp. SR21 TaxID=2919501 RepID=UPI001FA98D24|nr:signal peptidase I [Nocardioides sp. SR21]